MKKYFVKETDESVEFGDVLSVTFVKKTEDGKVTIEKEMEFNEDTLDLLIEMDIVEERDTEEDDLIDFEDDAPCEELSNLIESFESLEERVDKMETVIQEVYNIVSGEVKKGKTAKKGKK